MAVYQKPLPRFIHHYSDLTAVLFGFILNVLLISIINRNKQAELKSFNQIVFMNCVVDLFLVSTTLMSEIEAETDDGVLYIFANSFLTDYIPDKFHYALIFLWCTGVTLSVLYTPLPFYHRYMLVCKKVVLSTWNIFLAILAVISASLCISGWELFALIYSEPRRENLAQLLDKSLWSNSDDGSIPMFATFPIDNIPSFIFLINCVIFFPCSIALIFYFLSGLYRTFRENKDQMSARSIKLHRILNRALISQALLPFLVGIVPISVMISTMIFRFHIPLAGIITTAILAWIPTINAFLTIFLIPAYRRAILPKKYANRLMSLVESTEMPAKPMNNTIVRRTSFLPTIENPGA